MSSNVGLTTPRGSGTSGYVQRNLSHLKPRDGPYPSPRDAADERHSHRPRKPDEKILDHERRREIEVKVFELRDRLEDEGVDEEEIETRTAALRSKLSPTSSMPPPSDVRTDDLPGPESETDRRKRTKDLKPHQVHELAKAKIEESEKLRRALGIREDYEEGSHWRRQEERLREGVGGKGT
ncbi:MAG: hypothetical protein M4579_003624 [Chaenotheca gracillima]|nr:MAG: hypothetical protein M4579_003624 [Chaenotheca gracillima]